MKDRGWGKGNKLRSFSTYRGKTVSGTSHCKHPSLSSMWKIEDDDFPDCMYLKLTTAWVKGNV